jgi:hypothetical protein
MKIEYKSEAIAVGHRDMMAMHKLGLISDERMREFDEMAFVQEAKPAAPVPRTATQEPAVLPHYGAPVYARGK